MLLLLPLTKQRVYFEPELVNSRGCWNPLTSCTQSERRRFEAVSQRPVDRRVQPMPA